MRRDSGQEQLNTRQIEDHLRSALDTLMPDVLDRIDLSAAQEAVPETELHSQAVIRRLERRMRGFALAAAACFCVVLMGGGAYQYHVQNARVESVIGIDVNPSVELSINRREKVLETRALNGDAETILDGMDLKGVDLNVAVNAVVGSMVTHGYLDDLDNAILVTVSNDSVRKARELRAAVVGDIERTLEENQVEAVVYDQQVIEEDEIKELASQYGISYGKAYFLKELIQQNEKLTMDDMEELSSMTMEEIARRIAEDSYALGEMADKATRAAETEAPRTEAATEPSETSPEETSAEETAAETTVPSSEETDTAAETTASSAEETEPEVEPGLIEIDYVDCEDGSVYVCFMEPVDWDDPTVSVRDEEGNSYAAMVGDTSRDDCVIEAAGLEGGRSYVFVLGGIIDRETGTATTVTGYFDMPEIAERAEEEYTDPDETEEETSRDDDDDDDDDRETGGGGSSVKESGSAGDGGPSKDGGGAGDGSSVKDDSSTGDGSSVKNGGSTGDGGFAGGSEGAGDDRSGDSGSGDGYSGAGSEGAGEDRSRAGGEEKGAAGGDGDVGAGA